MTLLALRIRWAYFLIALDFKTFIHSKQTLLLLLVLPTHNFAQAEFSFANTRELSLLIKQFSPIILPSPSHLNCSLTDEESLGLFCR